MANTVFDNHTLTVFPLSNFMIVASPDLLQLKLRFFPKFKGGKQSVLTI